MQRGVQLHLGTCFDDLWREVAAPWFVQAAREALASDQPWVVLTPGRSLAQALKVRLLEAGRPLAGVNFWTPGDLRHALRLRCPTPATVAVREHLHLLLAGVAAGHDDTPAAAVTRDPARLLRAIDQLAAAGHAPSELAFPPAEKLAAEWRAALAAAGWTTVQDFDLALARQPPAAPWSHLLILGFDAAHWELWPLLKAAVQGAQTARVALIRPRSKAEDLDQAWVGTWEESFGEALPVDEAQPPGAFALLAQRMENPEGAAQAAAGTPLVLVGRNVREQAEAVAAQCTAWLAGGEVTRLGVLLPGPGPLAREISVQLLDLGLPHFDAFGHAPPPTPASLRWRAWIALQRSFRLQPLRELLELSPELDRPPTLERGLQHAFNDVLVDDLDVLAARAPHLGRDDTRAAATFLRRFLRLPDTAPLADLLAATQRAWAELGWGDLAAELDRQADALAPVAANRYPTPVFLAWLESVAPVPGPVRDADAAQPAARIHLLPYAQAEGLAWSHLILADMNEGRWPPPVETSGYLADSRITALNQSVLATGRQGEGHVCVRPGHALMLGPNERRALHRRQFYNLVESARCGLALACSLEGEEDGGRILPAGDYLSHLYFVAFERPLSEATLQALQAATRQRLATRARAGDADLAPQPTPPAQAGIAYDARRQLTSFGVYECAFDGPPPRAIALSCKTWQDAVRSPSSVWMKEFLGVEPGPEAEVQNSWPLTRGIWVHAWLARALGSASGRFEPRAQGEEILARAVRAAGRTRDEITASFTAGGRAAPEWWQARWSHAEWMARQFARRLGELEGWGWAATEWDLPKPATVPCGDRALRLRGRVDLLLSAAETQGLPDACWLADFKTGGDRELSVKNLDKKLAQGNGIQLALYALVLAHAGSRAVHVSLLTAESPLRPQLELEDVRAQAAFWHALAAMQDSGVFGMRGALRTEYGVGLELPLATLAIPPDTLETKWQRTHPDLAGPLEGDDEG